MRRAWLAVALLAATSAASAGGLYRWVDEGGQVHFSDTPRAGATSVRPGGVQVVRPARRPEATSDAIPFVEQGGAMLVEGEACGRPLRFVLDTGASFVVVPPQAVAADAVGRAPRVRVQTANGVVTAPRLRCRVRIGRLVRDGVDVVVQSVGAPAVGLLGMSFLGGYRIEIDREAGLLRLRRR